MTKINKLDHTHHIQGFETEWKNRMLDDINRPQEDIQVEKYGRYYDEANEIVTAAASNPNDQDSGVYNIEAVHNALQRNAEKIQVINDEASGGNTLFICVSHGGGQTCSPERPLYPGEHKQYLNVYEFRLRSAKRGHQYRVSEYKF